MREKRTPLTEDRSAHVCSKCGEPFFENERLRRELRATERTLRSLRMSQPKRYGVKWLPLYTMDTVRNVAKP